MPTAFATFQNLNLGGFLCQFSTLVVKLLLKPDNRLLLLYRILIALLQLSLQDIQRFAQRVNGFGLVFSLLSLFVLFDKIQV